MCFRAIAAALLTSALLLQVRRDTPKFVVQDSRTVPTVQSLKHPEASVLRDQLPRLGERLTAKRASALLLRTRSDANQAWEEGWRPPRTLGGHCVCGRRLSMQVRSAASGKRDFSAQRQSAQNRIQNRTNSALFGRLQEIPGTVGLRGTCGQQLGERGRSSAMGSTISGAI